MVKLIFYLLVKQSKHDEYVDHLRNKILDDYDSVLTNVPIYLKKKRKKRLVGEIDLLAKKGSVYDIYEVKCSHRITKARMQMKKLRKNLVSTHKIDRAYFYCGSSEKLFEI
jgi:hypothetical protein